MVDLDPNGPVTLVSDTPISTPESGTTEAEPSATDDGSAQTEPDGGSGQAANAPAEPATETPVFFDPKDLDESLMPAYKNMQAAFSKKTAAVAQGRDKIKAYDDFLDDPVGNLKKLAVQHGLTLSGQADGQQQEPGQGQDGESFNPSSWEEVKDWVQTQVMGQVKTDFQPMIESVQKQNASNVEKQLDKIDPEWRLYEDDMRQTIQAHPTLAGDVSKLYKMSVPDDVLSRKAVQSALGKIQSKTNAARVHTGSVNKKTVAAPKEKMDFNEAVAFAKHQISG